MEFLSLFVLWSGGLFIFIFFICASIAIINETIKYLKR